MKNLMLAVAALSLAALTGAALATPAHAGDTSCQGYVYVEGATGYISDPEGDFGTIVGNGDHCSFPTASKVGKMILAKCSVGWECHIQLPLDASTQPIKTTRLEITKGCHGRCGWRIYDQNRNLVKIIEAGPAPVRDNPNWRRSWSPAKE